MRQGIQALDRETLAGRLTDADNPPCLDIELLFTGRAAGTLQMPLPPLFSPLLLCPPESRPETFANVAVTASDPRVDTDIHAKISPRVHRFRLLVGHKHASI
jgi:hypothetical protein